MDEAVRRPERVPTAQRPRGERTYRRGRLKIFFGYAEGVGKTYAMLDDAREQFRLGVDVLVGFVEPGMHPDTLQLIKGLPVMPPKSAANDPLLQREFDLDAALARKPQLILIDSLAHSNLEGARNKKRYQDIEELLNVGIDVYTTINVQNIESLNDVVENITRIPVHETVPDYVFDRAEMVKLVDIDPGELLVRFNERKVLSLRQGDEQWSAFFTEENLKLLREIAMLKAASRIGHENQSARPFPSRASNGRLLVCVSASPFSTRCIRWCARMAEAFYAPWAAIYVEDAQNERLSDSERETVRSNLSLAEKLGAEIVTLNGYDVAQTVAEYAKLAHITNIVVGKSRNKRTITALFETDFEDRLIELIPGIEVSIIPGGSAAYAHKRPTTLWGKNLVFSTADTLKTFGLLAAATLLSFWLDALGMSDQSGIMAYLLCVLLVSRFTAGYFYGIAASALSVLAYNYFFTVPYFTFMMLSRHPITLVIMLVAALITSTLTVRIKDQAKLAVERERRTDALFEINKNLLSTRGLDSTVALTNDTIVKLFGRSTIFYTRDPAEAQGYSILRAPEDADDPAFQSKEEQAIAHWVFLNQKPAGAGTDTFAQARAFYLPVLAQGRVLGVLGLSCSAGPIDHGQLLFLRTIASQVAMALERQQLSDEQRRILVEAEKEKMRSNLLRAISHDLRTPLTGILGASSAILENEESFDRATRERLIRNIKEDSQWLIRMVENLLSVTRIRQGTMNVAKTPEAAEEILAASVSRIRKRFVSSNIRVRVPSELLIVPMDGTLIVQVLINLLENAIKHSPESALVEVEVKKDGQTAVFEVIDHGEGIAEEELSTLFEGYGATKRQGSDSSRGMGVGLSICKSIIRAHGGNLEAENGKEGGAIFRFTLPLEEGGDANGQ
ncbi:MAG: sensor histidine kinase KdpD [Bacillota bacterium]